MGGLDVLHLVDLLDKDLERAIDELGQRMFDQLIAQSPLVILVAAPQTTTLVAESFPEEAADVDGLLDHIPTHKAQTDDVTVDRGGLEILVEVPRADEIDDQVGTLAVRILEQFLRPVARLVIETLGRAERLAEVDLLLAAGRHIDCFGAVGFGELDAGNRDTARAGVPQHAHARLVVADKVQRLRRRDPRLGDPRGLLPAEFLGLVDQHMRADRDILGVCTSIRQPENLVADVEPPLRLAAKRFNRARELHPERRRRLWWQGIHALPLQQVHAVESKRLDLDDGLGARGSWFGRVRVDEECRDRPFPALDVDCAHGGHGRVVFGLECPCLFPSDCWCGCGCNIVR